jgi:hypothetical protein
MSLPTSKHMQNKQIRVTLKNSKKEKPSNQFIFDYDTTFTPVERRSITVVPANLSK